MVSSYFIFCLLVWVVSRLRTCPCDVVIFLYIQTPEALRLGVLLEVLAVKESALAPVPVHLQLAVAVTGFWLQEATPRPSQPLVQALVLNMVYGEVSWNSQPRATHHHHAGYLDWICLIVKRGKKPDLHLIS